MSVKGIFVFLMTKVIKNYFKLIEKLDEYLKNNVNL